MRFTGELFAAIFTHSFLGCQDRDIEPLGGNNPIPSIKSKSGAIVPVVRNRDTVNSFVVPTAPLLKNVIGRARWAMQDDTSKQAKLDVRRMQLNSFKSRCPKSVYSRSIFSVNKQLGFGDECTKALDEVSVSSFTSAGDPKRTIVNVRGCLSVDPNAFAFFEMNLIAGTDDLVKYINERPPKHGQCKRVFDADRWQPESNKDDKTTIVKIDGKSGKFLKKLANILRPFFEKEGILHKQKVSAMMFRLLRSDTLEDGKVVVNKEQSVAPVILYVGTPSDEKAAP